MGEAEYSTVTQFPRPLDHGTFFRQRHKEIIGCLRQRYTCGLRSIYSSQRRGSRGGETRGGSALFEPSAVETLLFVVEDRAITLCKRPGDDKAVRGPHTNTHMCLENWQKPSDNFRNKGEISREWSYSHPAVHNTGTSTRSTTELQIITFVIF